MSVIVGHCPMGCGATVYQQPDGPLWCAAPDCPRRTAASEILNDPETEHIVELGPHTFNVMHPLRERLDGALLTCDLGDWLKRQPGPPAAPGRYRARIERGQWLLEPIGDRDP